MTIKELFAPSDMTVGKPWEKIVAFTIPMLIGNIAQQLYNTVDSIVIGKYVGDNALAAVGSASPILNLLLVLFVGISVGAGVMVSQYFGARQRKELSMMIGNCVTLTAISSIIIMILGAVLSRPLLEMLKTPDSIIDWCTSYLVILMVGCAGSAYYNILCGILRGLGDSISALIYLLVATVINIVLDIVFVSQFHMGVAGVAYATVIAQAISAVLCMWRLMRMTDIFDFRPKYLKMKKQYSMEIIRLGLPSGITQAIFSMAMVIVQSLTNSFGEMVIAANVIIMRVDGFAMMPNFSFGTAMTTYAGQNVGARRMDRVEQQRVAIARALAKNPKLLLCDEPTGALDYVTGKAILKLLQDTCREKGMTVIVITHNSALTPMADRVIKIRNGKVAGMKTNENPTPVEEIEW